MRGNNENLEVEVERRNRFVKIRPIIFAVPYFGCDALGLRK